MRRIRASLAFAIASRFFRHFRDCRGARAPRPAADPGDGLAGRPVPGAPAKAPRDGGGRPERSPRLPIIHVVPTTPARTSTARRRQAGSVVYRLKNVPATDAAKAISELLRSEPQLRGPQGPAFQASSSPIAKIVAEPVSNSAADRGSVRHGR